MVFFYLSRRTPSVPSQSVPWTGGSSGGVVGVSGFPLRGRLAHNT